MEAEVEFTFSTLHSNPKQVLNSLIKLSILTGQTSSSSKSKLPHNNQPSKWQDFTNYLYKAISNYETYTESSWNSMIQIRLEKPVWEFQERNQMWHRINFTKMTQWDLWKDLVWTQLVKTQGSRMRGMGCSRILVYRGVCIRLIRMSSLGFRCLMRLGVQCQGMIILMFGFIEIFSRMIIKESKKVWLMRRYLSTASISTFKPMNLNSSNKKQFQTIKFQDQSCISKAQSIINSPAQSATSPQSPSSKQTVSSALFTTTSNSQTSIFEPIKSSNPEMKSSSHLFFIIEAQFSSHSDIDKSS